MAGSDKRKLLIPWLIIFGLWAVLHGALAASVASRVFEGRLAGPDEYMRLVRVTELRDGAGWYDSVIERSNAPYGSTMHWTRPLDVLILGGAYALSPFLGAKDALFISGVLISPLLDLLICLAMAWAALPLFDRDRAILAALLVLIQPSVLAYSAAGRADHHTLLFLLFVIALGGTVRLLSPRPTTRGALAAGIAYGMAIWVSVEMTLLVALCQATTAFAWVRFREIKARPQLIAAAAFLATMLLALVLEHPPSALLAVELDQVSLPFAVMALLTCAVWGTARATERRYPDRITTPVRRAILLGAAGGIGVLILLALFPQLLAGPLAGVDPRIMQIWDAHVTENASLLPRNLKMAGKFLLLIGAVGPCLVYVAIVAWRRRNDPDSLPWTFLSILIAVYFALALELVRVAPFAEIASVPVLTVITARLGTWSEHRKNRLFRLLATGATAFLAMFGSVVAGTWLLTISAAASPRHHEPQCRLTHIAPLLNDPAGLGAKPLVIGALIDRGPEILYRTRDLVVGTPYHRNGAGIWDSYRLFAAPKNAESRAIINRRGIDLLLICPSSAEKLFFTRQTGKDSLYTRLLDGKTPDWLAQVPIEPDRADGYRLYRVLR